MNNEDKAIAAFGIGCMFWFALIATVVISFGLWGLVTLINWVVS